MAVTDIVRDENTYTDEWIEKPADVQKALNDYNKSSNRFLFYPWGVWVTAYARRNLFTGIFEFAEDYIYADTDSVKVVNAERHAGYIEKYNAWIIDRLYKALDAHKIPRSAIEPETIKGIKKPLGVWDFDKQHDYYNRFKTLGAKRYMVDINGQINITVSGLNKRVTVPYLIEKYGDRVFDEFNDNLYIPPEYTGKNTHTYIDDEYAGTVVDYLGKSETYHELSSVHLENADYTLSLSHEYYEYFMNVQHYEYL